MLIDEKISRWLSRRNAHVSRNQGKIAPSRVCAWFENKRFDWPSVSFSFATFLSINLISSFCTNFVFSALKKFQVFALFGIKWHALSQSAWRNLCMYIIIVKIPVCFCFFGFPPSDFSLFFALAIDFTKSKTNCICIQITTTDSFHMADYF